jgi:aryl-alcohol dehydrogenase-like predicted oxidoreductase
MFEKAAAAGWRNSGQSSMQLGLGTWGFSGVQVCDGVRLGWPPLAHGLQSEILATATNAGIRCIDTADFYGLGAVEHLLGRHLADTPDIRIFTKGGLINKYDAAGRQIRRDFSPEYLRHAIDRSRQRLQRDVIDIYQLHGPDLEHLLDQSLWRFLEKELASGRIARLGVSVRTRELTPAYERALIGREAVHAVQLPLSPIDENMRDFATAIRDRGKVVLGRSVFKHGLLVRRDWRGLAADDQRRDFMSPELTAKITKKRTELDSLAARKNCSLAQAIVGDLAENNVCDILLFGASSPLHVLENVQTLARDHDAAG